MDETNCSFVVMEQFSDEHEAWGTEENVTDDCFVMDKVIEKKSVIDSTLMSRLNKVVLKMFNNPENSDFVFKIKINKTQDQFECIYVQKCFITEASEYFRTMLSKEWSESNANEVLITDYSFEAYYQYIQCLYTDIIDCEDTEVLIELLDISNTYLDEQSKYLCAQKINPLLNMQNACRLYASALQFRSKALEDFCFEFMAKNDIEIVDSKEFEEIDVNYAQRFLKRSVKHLNEKILVTNQGTTSFGTTSFGTTSFGSTCVVATRLPYYK